MPAIFIHLLRGTPHSFQGEELGVTNAGYTSIGQYRDVESLNHYQIMLQSSKSEAEALEILRQRSRDNGRTPMQWDALPRAGFTSGTPWITPPENFVTINAGAKAADTDSILHYYKRLIRLRKDRTITSAGNIELLASVPSEVFAYWCVLRNEELTVFNNLTEKMVTLEEPGLSGPCQTIIGNHPDTALRDGRLILWPYESVVMEHS